MVTKSSWLIKNILTDEDCQLHVGKMLLNLYFQWDDCKDDASLKNNGKEVFLPFIQSRFFRATEEVE